MKRNKNGFTLAELLVVIAILMILAGVSFVAVNRYIRNLHVLEMDNTAKEIFIVAQNHLSQSYASGEYQREYEEHKDDFGTKLTEKPSYLSGTEGSGTGGAGTTSIDGAEAEYRYFRFTGHPGEGASPDVRSGILSVMLPDFSIEGDVVDKGNFIIAYEVHSATILGVFYSGSTHTYFGSSPVHEFSADEAEENGNTYLKEARDDKEKRKHYKKDSEDSVIGCYIADGKDAIPEESLKPLKLTLDNGSRLMAIIENPNYKAGDTSKILTLVVKGLTSENTQIVKLESTGSTFDTSYKNTNGPEAADDVRTYASITDTYSTDGSKETYKFILDDVTSQNGHFCDAFPYLIPGEDVEVYAELSDTSSIASPVKSNVETSNSLFSGFTPVDSTGGTAEISSIRHLENMDPKISNVGFAGDSTFVEAHATELLPLITDIKVKDAVQTEELIYSGSEKSKTDSSGNTIIIKSYTKDISGSETSDGSTLKVYKYDGTTQLSAKGYYGISNSDLTSYDGQGLSIDKVYSEAGAEGNTGIFAEVNVTGSTKSFRLTNLTVKNSIFKASSNSGGLVGHNKGNLTITNCKVEGDTSIVSAGSGHAGGMVGSSEGKMEIKGSGVTGTGFSVSSANAGAAGLVAYSKGTLTVDNCIVKGSSFSVKSTSSYAGGIAARCDAAAAVTSAHIIGDNFSIGSSSDAGVPASDAGGILGSAAGTVDITSCSVKGDNIVITGKNTGGMLGNAAGAVTMSSCSSTGAKMKLAGENAGGILGVSGGGINISSTYCSSFVFATANAGGFIGNINAGSGNIIENCYVAGHTTGGKYGTGTDINTAQINLANNYNIISAGAAGGFIGRNSVDTTVNNSYTTCSVYSSSSSAADGFAGGFVGKGTVLKVNNCYSAGPVAIAEGGTAGGFAGQGTSASGQSYYLKGQGFNASLSASGSSNVTNILSTGGAEISASGVAQDAKPWDTALSNVYPYKTVAELSGVAGTVNMHYGDWTIVEQNKLVLKIRNAEKLTAILEVPTSEISTAAGAHNYVSVCVNGMSSGKIAYMQFDLLPNDILPIGKEAALYNITASGGGDTSDSGDVVFPEYTFPVDKTLVVKQVENKTQFYIDLDDITTFKKNFASMFTGFEAGEDIRITAEWGAVSWDTLLNDAVSESSAEESESFTGITNSLFASGSGNSNYASKNYYSDVDPDRNIVNIGATASAYSGMALVTNFRHLQNLDISVSNVVDSYRKVKICRNLYWTLNDTSLQNVYTGFINTIMNGSAVVSIYPYSAANEYDAVATNNSFYGIVNNRITDFDGNGHSINNMLISNGSDNGTDNEKYSAGLFRVMDINSTETKNIHDLSIVQSVIVSRNGYAGGLIGSVSSSGFLNIENVFIYGKDALVRAIFDRDNGNNGTDAGGFIGSAVDGGYTVSNCGSSSYVYAEGKAICAGGFIGNFKPKKETAFTDCFVGGHINSSQDYVAEYAVSGDSNSISPNQEGGYNIYGQKAVGGFFGYAGTKSIDGGFTVTNCFTTASVYCEKSKSDGGAVGGFVGQMQHEKQKYSKCYMEGKVYAGTAYAGTFIGDYYKPQSEDNLRLENVYVLNGLNFNDDTNLNDVSFSRNSTTITGISRVDSDSSDIINQKAHMVRTEKFNKTPVDAKFPYRNNTMQGSEYVFYGDWVEPAKLVPIQLINGNRLTVSIELRDETKGSENHYGETYDVTYIRIKPDNNDVSTIFRILYKNGVIFKTERYDYNIAIMNQWNNNVYDDDKWGNVYDDGLSATMNGNRIDFYIDDISKFRGCYIQKVQYSVAGENITVYVGDSYEGEHGVKSDSALSVKGNSLFEKIVPNPDGNTYTAVVSNSRNLENLDTQISGININITNVEQGDDIYWQDDGTRPYTSNIKPYLTEIPDAHIFRNYSNAYATESEFMLPITKGANLREYDGKNKAIHGLKIGADYSGNSGIFGSVTDAFVIKNLFINNITVEATQSAGSIIGTTGWGNSLGIQNVHVNGILNITGVDSGGLIGNSNSKLILNNSNVNGNINISGFTNSGGVIGKQSGGTIQIDNVGITSGSGQVNNSNANNGSVGGFIGIVENSSIDIKNSFASVNVNGFGKVGGFVNCSNSSGILQKCYVSGHTFKGAYLDSFDTLSTGCYSVIGKGCTAIGGFIGYAAGNLTIKNCFSTNTAGSLYERDDEHNPYYIGCFAGQIDWGGVKINNCYSIGYIKVRNPQNNYYGSFAGKLSGGATIKDSYYLQRGDNIGLPAVGTLEGSLDNLINNEDYIIGYSETNDLSTMTVHHDQSRTDGYPYKNWTNANDTAPGSTPAIYFYGDW